MSTAFSNIVAAANVVMIITFIITGFCYSDSANWTDDPLPNGFTGIFSGTSVVFYAFNGFDACATLTEEVPNPEKVIPRGLLGAIAIVTAAYIGIGFALTGMVPYRELDDFAPFSAALARHEVTWAFYMITFSAVLNCWASSFASILAQPRLMYAIAKDGLLPRMFKQLDTRTRTPLKGTVVTGIITALFAGCLDFATLSMTVSCGILFVYVFTGVIILRFRYLPMLQASPYYQAAFHISVSSYVVACFWARLPSTMVTTSWPKHPLLLCSLALFFSSAYGQTSVGAVLLVPNSCALLCPSCHSPQLRSTRTLRSHSVLDLLAM